mgnify:CR=1 FL=1
MGDTDRKANVSLGHGCMLFFILVILIGVIAYSYWYTHQSPDRQKEIQIKAGKGLDKTARTVDEATSNVVDRIRKADWTSVNHAISNTLHSARSDTPSADSASTNDVAKP